MSLSTHTEKTIPIECNECPAKHIEIGLEAMIRHIEKSHLTYTKDESKYYAENWMIEAFEQDEENEAESAMSSKIEHDIDEAIERDIRFAKHGE
jgi:hypothetical protein